jgi:hypothetical protein
MLKYSQIETLELSSYSRQEYFMIIHLGLGDTPSFPTNSRISTRNRQQPSIGLRDSLDSVDRNTKLARTSEERTLVPQRCHGTLAIMQRRYI